MRSLRSRTSFTPVWPFDPTPLRTPSIRKTRMRGSVNRHSRHHFMVNCGGTITKAVNGRPFACTYIAPSEIRVFPVSHSAIAPAEASMSQRLAIPAMARDWAG
jgi:hypothetical protein